MILTGWSAGGHLAALLLDHPAIAGGCAISLPEDTFVSSLHARVYAADGQVLVEDLGSTNGTFVNQARVTTTMPLAKGDRLKVGSTVLEAR